MSYKIAGIDVHKKVLMVVVLDASTPEEKPERRRFPTMPSDLRAMMSPCRASGSFNFRFRFSITKHYYCIRFITIAKTYTSSTCVSIGIPPKASSRADAADSLTFATWNKAGLAKPPDPLVKESEQSCIRTR
jgi:hypothetical protein